MIVVIIVIVVIIALVGFVVVGFNKLRRSDIGAQEALGGIDVQLTRRADLIPNLVETVKGYAAHERGVFDEVTAARAGLQAAARGDDVPAKAAADARMQGALANINAVAENYPDLKANQNFLALQSQLAETENQISFARQYYNDAVATLNKQTQTIPWNLFTGMANVRKRDFYEAPAGADVAPQVSFGAGGTPPATPAVEAPTPPPSIPPAASADAPPAVPPADPAPPTTPPSAPTS